jgi:hypothetical protein
VSILVGSEYLCALHSSAVVVTMACGLSIRGACCGFASCHHRGLTSFMAMIVIVRE